MLEQVSFKAPNGQKNLVQNNDTLDKTKSTSPLISPATKDGMIA